MLVGLVAIVVVALVFDFHQWLPRRRQRDRHVHRHARADPTRRPRHGCCDEPRRRVDQHRGADGSAGIIATPSGEHGLLVVAAAVLGAMALALRHLPGRERDTAWQATFDAARRVTANQAREQSTPTEAAHNWMHR